MITTTSELSEFIALAYKAPILVVDTEGDAQDIRDAASGAVTMGASLVYRRPDRTIAGEYFAFFHKMGDNQPEFFDAVCELITNHPCVLFHNAKHDIVALELWKVFRKKKFYDSMLMCHQVNENELSYALDYLSQKYGGAPKNRSTKMDQIIEMFGWAYIPASDMRPYAINDGVIELELFEDVLPKFKAQGLDGKLWDREQRWVRTIARMEQLGICIDIELCKKEIIKGKIRMAEITKVLGNRKPSGNDLKTILLDELKLPVVKRTPKKNAPCFDKEAMKIYSGMLEMINSPVAKQVIEFRGWQKVVATNYEAYVRFLGKDGRLHFNYKIHGTKTRRLSSGSDSDGEREVTSPNMQNIPKISTNEWDGNLKNAFVATEGFTLWEADYAQLELRLTACYSKDDTLIESFRNGEKIFDVLAADLGWKRDDVKTFYYATSYGAQDERIAHGFGITTEEAHRMRVQFFIEKYPKIGIQRQKVVKSAEHHLYTKYWTGSRRHYRSKREARHLSWNSLMQGGGAELVKERGIELHDIIDWSDCRMLLQTHDSYTFEIRNGTEDHWLPIIRKTMESVPDVLGSIVPFPVEIKRWGS